MYAVIRKTDDSVIYTCNSKEAAIVAAQLEKSKVGIADRQNITAVVGYHVLNRSNRFKRQFPAEKAGNCRFQVLSLMQKTLEPKSPCTRSAAS